MNIDLYSLPSLNSLSVTSDVSSGINIFEDTFFWERLKFEWVSNLYSFSDFAFTFVDYDPDAMLIVPPDTNFLKHLLKHWQDLANRHSNIEKLNVLEYKFIYLDSFKCSSNLRDFLQLEIIKTSQSSDQPARKLKRCNSDSSYHHYDPISYQSGWASQPSLLKDSFSVNNEIDEENKGVNISININCDVNRRDNITLEFVDYLNSLNQNLALYLLIEGPKTIPWKFRNIYKKLIKMSCKAHGTFLPTMINMKKDDRLRPIEYEGSWESDAICDICYETHGAFVKRCCDIVVCESCFTHYVNHQVNSLNRIHVQCPAMYCQKPIRFQSIWIRLTENNRLTYEKIKNNQQQTTTRKLCPHCMQFYELNSLEKEHYMKKKFKKLYKHGFNVKCHLCDWEWCFKCQTPIHSITCKKNTSIDKLLMKWANSPASDAMHIAMKKARKCPKCHILVERNGGCPHMECMNCKCAWCYDCGCRRIKVKHIPFMSHDSKFFILGCSKNFNATKPHLRRFVRGCVMCGITMLIIPASAIAVLLAGALAVLLGLPFGFYKLGLKLHQRSNSK